MSQAKKKKAVKKTNARKILGGIFYIFFLSGLVFAGGIAGWLNGSEVIRETVLQGLTKKTPQKVFSDSNDGGDSLTVLILGCDKDLYYGGKQVIHSHARSDMMMVARVDFNRKMVGAISIPRDTLCEIPGYRRQKINAYHAIGGPELSKKAVEKLLPGVNIDRVAVLNFDAFVEIVDMLGGVELYVPKDMKYNDNAGNLHINLKKGRQHLNGTDALGFVRFRKGSNGGDSDFERQKRQKDLMLALKEKMIKNWTQATNVLDKTVDLSGKAFDNEEMASLVLFMKSVETEKIRMGQVPVVDIPGTYDLSVDGTKLDKALREFRVVPMSDSEYAQLSTK
ncbi:MAG: LCP family protein [Fimbriimonadaceae bacterium]|nr:MAG: LCP family protein [Fimbriimonadaceae bacterium]